MTFYINNNLHLYDTTRMYEQNHNMSYSFLDFLLCFLENLRLRRNLGSIWCEMKKKKMKRIC